MTTFSNYLRICLATFVLAGMFQSASAQTYFSEDFNNVTGFPVGWTRANQDGRTPDANVSFINNAWIATALSATDSAAISTSWYVPAGMADDWMFTPAITLPMGSNPRLRWAARSLNNTFRDGYQVYIQTTAPTTSGNPVVGATLLLTIAAEDTAWQARTINLGAGYAGQTVYISFRNNSNDMVALLVDDVLVENTPSAPVNDNCAQATTLTSGATCTPTAGTTSGATTSGLAVQLCNGFTGSAEDDVWYQFVATAASHNVTVVGGASFDAVIEVYGGTCAAPTFISCADATVAGGTETATLTGLTVGTTYRVRVFDYEATASATPTFTICVTGAAAAPANDNCANATVLTPGATCVPTNGTTAGATTSGLAVQACFGFTGTAEDDVWYQFVATSTTHYVNVTGAANFDAVIEVYGGTCAAPTFLNCADQVGIAGTEFVSVSGLTVGNTYRVRVFDYEATASTTPTFTICVTTPCALTTPAGAILETEACGDSSNNGCQRVVPQYGSISCGQTVAGTVFANNGLRDFDYYSFTLSAADSVHLTVNSEFPVIVQIVSVPAVGGCASITLASAAGAGIQVNSCQTANTSAFIATAGTYYVRVFPTTFFGLPCGAGPNDYNLSFRIGQQMASTTTPTNAICTAANGSATSATTGGRTPYTFAWSNSTSGQNLSNVAAGTYTLTVTDANLCRVTTSTTVGTTTNTVNTTISNTPVVCLTQGTASLTTPTGGTAPYAFNWGGGITIQNRINLPAATYNVTVTDANGCSTTRSTVVASTSSTISSTISNTPAGCVTLGTANLTTPTGGTTPYAFNWGGGITSQNRVGLAAGSYTVTITDANGCATTRSTNVASSAITVTGSSATTATSCGVSTGVATVTASNGQSPYNFLWSNAATTQTITGLGAGSYNVTITDANGCTGVVSNITVANPAAPSLSVSGFTNVSCNGGNNGAVTVTASGGTSPYNFVWSNGAIGASATGLTAGAYTVTVTDAALCAFTLVQNINQPAILSLSAFATDITCNGANNGSINTTITGGTPNYNFVWSNAATTQNISGLGTGTYGLTVTDANGCSANTSRSIAQPANALSVATTATNIACNGAANGAVSATVTGGTTAYAFSWSNGETSQNIAALAAGVYSLTVTDANGCVGTSSRTITEPAALAAVATGATVSCANNISLAVTGGTTAYSFLWSNGATSQDLSNVAAATYTVTVTDANNCQTTASAAVTGTGAPSVSAVSTIETSQGAADGTATLTVTGTGPFTFAWSNGATTQDISGLTGGTYTVTVSNATCSATTTVTVTTAVAIENLSSDWSLNIFPNPATNVATLSLELPQTAKSIQVQLVDISGRVINSQEYSQVANVQQQFDAQALSAGVYFVRINVDGVRATRKLIVSGQ
jgi:hypothetical protein